MFYYTDSSIHLLAGWRWMLAPDARLLGWASSGDLFVVDAHGAVSRLDTGGGELEPVAESPDEFKQALHVPARAEELLLLPVVRAFEEQHGPLADRECLGFTTLPVLGGTYTVENRFRLSITEHAAMTGDLHRQLRDLPDGTEVSVEIVP